MDAGVGSIIVTSAFAAGMKGAAVANNARTRSSSGRARRDWTRLGALAALGGARALAIAVLDYQNHVGEYGVHWNFFLTLAAVRALTLFMPRAAAGSPWASGILGMGVLGAHQGLLSLGGLSGVVNAVTRGPDLLSKNKEGIFSLPGYFALHLLGCACGAALEETAGPSSNMRAGQRRRVAALVTALWAAFLAATVWLEPVSRRSCNASYVFWMLALNAQSLAALAGATATLPTQPLPRLLQAVSDTMLPTFLVANLLTGAVNMAIDTMKVGDWVARAVVSGYTAAVAVAALIAHHLISQDDRGFGVGWRR
jgi:phosphatidylinositol glycan class W